MNYFRRPDFSNFVVHFTKDGRLCSADDTRKPTIEPLSAKERFFSILKDRNIKATTMPWTNKEATCFTECTWSSLLGHAKRYSKFGIGFSKEHLFKHGGAPAIYLTPGLMQHQKTYCQGHYPFDETLYSFITPFCPEYASEDYKNNYWKGKKPLDFSHEREWRVPHSLAFGLSDIQFVIVASYDDMAKADKKLKDAIGRDKWILMDNYEKVEQLWPMHKY